MIAESQNAYNWPIRSCDVALALPRTAPLTDELASLLNVLNCLPGIGTLTLVINALQSTRHDLPFATSYVPINVRSGLIRALKIGGGCEIRLQTPQATFVFAVCLGSGKWNGCSAQQVRESLEPPPTEIATDFPKAGTVERLI